uniref:Uncharacterized protein n=1 Tax=Panagrolaimus superbus TaxID=310955 RepID=A0A914Y1G7_9BILA
MTTSTQEQQQSSDLIKVGFSDLKQGEGSFWNYESKLFSISAIKDYVNIWKIELYAFVIKLINFLSSAFLMDMVVM